MKPAEPNFDLPRLDASSPVLGDAVATLRQHQPDAADLASLASRLALAGIDVSMPAPAAKRPPTRWKKWLAGGGAASGALIWLAVSAKSPAPAKAPNVESHGAAVAAQPATHGAAPSNATRLPNGAPLGAPPATSADTELSAPTEANDNVPAPSVADAGKAAATEPAAPALAMPATSGSQAHAPSSATPRTASSANVVPAEAAGAPTEIQLLRDARLALKQSPERALALVDAHARAYPGGKLTQERELIGISALVALGRRTAALSRGARFQRDFPNSPYRNQVEQLLR